MEGNWSAGRRYIVEGPWYYFATNGIVYEGLPK